MLNFLGQDLVDATTNKPQYQQMQPAPPDGSLPLASNKWYMLQYEMAYDPNISSIPYNSIQLSWNLNYYNVTNIAMEGTSVGQLNGIIGVATNTNPFSSITSELKTIGTGAIKGIGKNFIDNNKDTNFDKNKLGLSFNLFHDLSDGVSKALSDFAGGLPRAGIKLLSSIIGGSSGSGPIPISLTMRTEIKLNGTGTNSGSLPSTPISFWVPGTNITSDAVGFIPLYNKTLGVVNFSGKPTITIPYSAISWQEPDEPFDPDQMITVTEYTAHFPQTIDYSNYLIINPEVSSVATVTVERQDLVMRYVNRNHPYDILTEINPDEFLLWNEGFSWSSQQVNYPSGLVVAVRFTIKVAPFNGSPSSIITKTFALNDTYIQTE